ncbi:hypothetical protein GCM10009687_75490 [Asanoa iriomotensis]|uniref:Uncharacterized protein n=2 Tax=Asanoa iriomotensis TaxID=234613 RepID=A0ABQ4C855_9ACTN|nr:hypothetical protein Air01nite_50530 [Asanoa iriomotensis]
MHRELTIRLDLATARDLRDLIYGFGEHIAAGESLPIFDSASSQRLGKVLDVLEELLRDRGPTR